jgi:hypothetical protein
MATKAVTEPKIRFRPTDETLYGRALELAVQGRRAIDPLPLSAAQIARALETARRKGISEGWLRAGRRGSRSNPWDVAYEFATRRAPPDSVAAYGYTGTVVAADGGYFLRKGISPRIELPDPDDVIPIQVRDLVPEAVREMVPGNEQGILARVGESGVLRSFLGVQATFRIVAHWSMANAEMDEVYAAIDEGDVVLVPVEAKSQGRRDALTRPQFTRAVTAMHRTFPGHVVRPVGVKVVDSQSFFLVEFNETEEPDDLEIQRLVRYVFVDPAADSGQR